VYRIEMNRPCAWLIFDTGWIMIVFVHGARGIEMILRDTISSAQHYAGNRE
jgi:succinate dehydrogenase hydrophobic anchor subunit